MLVDFSTISVQNIGQTITVGGFVSSIRDHGGLIFIDLRSETQLLQCVINPEKNPTYFAVAEQIHNEYVLRISGHIIAREEGLINPNIATGSVELEIETLEIVATAKTLPFDIHAKDSQLANEEIRLKYRYLDLRREKLKNLMWKKHELFLAARNWFAKEKFIEVQTPILANSSPEGARDFLVPSRLHPGKFYALPQAPQQFKQLLMVGGFNRYMQIAPCFRDEDPRSDRHPGDFYQIDAEVAWADQDEIYDICWRLISEVFAGHTNKKLVSHFPKIRYDDAMNWYGSDRPELRISQQVSEKKPFVDQVSQLAWVDAKSVFDGSEFKVFADLCSNPSSRVQALIIKNAVDKFSRAHFDKIQDIGRSFGLPGIAYIQYTSDGAKSPIFKFFGDEAAQATKQAEIQNYFGAEIGDIVLFLAHENKELIFKAQHAIRIHVAKKLEILDENSLAFAWIYNFPFFEADEKTGTVDFAHNPFGIFQAWEGLTHLQTLEKAKTENRLLEIRAIQYDIACNGYEVLSGGRRNNIPELLMESFKTVGYTEEEVTRKFKHMLEAYTYGAPPHAGFAWGVERILMILNDEDNIREVIAFPKNGSGLDAMLDSPTVVSKKQLSELHIQVDVEE